MKTVWKYEISATDNEIINIPLGAKILDVQIQGDDPFFWALVDPEMEKEERRVSVIGTGWEREGLNGEYIGTFQVPQNGLVFHVFID